VITRFQEVSASRKVRVSCIACGKALVRTVREFQTINPYNRRGEDGSPKTEAEIRRELPAQLDAAERRLRQRAICRACEALGHRIDFMGEHVSPGGVS
jgi:hypothetical protein